MSTSSSASQRPSTTAKRPSVSFVSSSQPSVRRVLTAEQQASRAAAEKQNEEFKKELLEQCGQALAKFDRSAAPEAVKLQRQRERLTIAANLRREAAASSMRAKRTRTSQPPPRAHAQQHRRIQRAAQEQEEGAEDEQQSDVQHVSVEQEQQQKHAEEDDAYEEARPHRAKRVASPKALPRLLPRASAPVVDSARLTRGAVSGGFLNRKTITSARVAGRRVPSAGQKASRAAADKQNEEFKKAMLEQCGQALAKFDRSAVPEAVKLQRQRERLTIAANLRREAAAAAMRACKRPSTQSSSERSSSHKRAKM